MIAVLSLLIVCSFSAVGLWTLWAARLPWHWLLRVLLALAPVSLLLLVPAYEPFVAFVTEIAVVAGGVTLGAPWYRRRREPRTPDAPHGVRFSLGSLLGVMLLIGAAAAVGARLPPLGWQTWVNTVLIGASCGMCVLIGAWFVRIRIRSWHVLLGVLLCGAIAQPLMWTDYLLPSFRELLLANSLFGRNTGPRWAWAFILPCIAGIVGLIVLWAARSGWLPSSRALISRPSSTVSPVRRQLLRIELVVLCLMLVALPAYFLFRMVFPDPLPTQSPPVPNGYDDLLAAAEMVNDPVFGNLDTASEAELRKALGQFESQALERLRLGLSRKSLVPVKYDIEADVTLNAQEFRSLARAMMAQAQAHRYKENWELAAAAYLDIVQLGQQVRTGGLMTHALVGSAISGFGQFALVEIRRILAPDTSAHAARRLLAIDEAGESVARIVHRERIWIQHVLDWYGRVALTLHDLCSEPFTNVQSFVRAMDESQAIRRLLVLEFALQAYIAEHESPPESLEDLVPEYLPRIPQDPFSGGPFSYSRTENGYSLTAAGSGRELSPPSRLGALMWRGNGRIEPFSLDEWYSEQNRK